MLVADHISAVKRSFESRAMPETEKPPARLVDIYYEVNTTRYVRGTVPFSVKKTTSYTIMKLARQPNQIVKEVVI